MDLPSGPTPEPAYKTISLRLPIPRRKTLLVAGAAVALAGACVFGGWSLHRQGAAEARWDEARQELDPSVAKVLERNRTRLDDLETDLKALNQVVDHGLAATASAGIDLDRVRTGRDDFGARLARIAGDLKSIGQREDSTESAYRLPANADDTLLTERQRGALALLRQRQAADAGQVGALDDRIASLTRHRESVALAEQSAAHFAAQEQAAQNEQTFQAKLDGTRAPTPLPASMDAPAAPSNRLLADAAQMQADALAPSSGPVARAVSDSTGDAPSVVIPEDPAPPAQPPPQTVVIEQPPQVTTYYFGYSTPYIEPPYYYRPYRYYPSGPTIIIGGSHGGHGHGPGWHH